MKKLLSLLKVFFIAIGNNLDPVQVDDMSFTDDSYYSGRTHTAVDYQSMYSTYIDSSATVSNGCNTTPVSAGDINNRPSSNSGRIWFIYENTDDVTSLYSSKKKETSLGAKDGDTIVAPATCVIASSANKSRSGTEMTISVGSYRITFYNMARWYCCRNRKPSLKKDITATFTHTKDAKGQRLSQGDILGYATTNTTVLVEEIGEDGNYSVVSTKDFFD